MCSQAVVLVHHRHFIDLSFINAQSTISATLKFCAGCAVPSSKCFECPGCTESLTFSWARCSVSVPMQKRAHMPLPRYVWCLPNSKTEGVVLVLFNELRSQWKLGSHVFPRPSLVYWMEQTSRSLHSSGKNILEILQWRGLRAYWYEKRLSG